MDAILPEKLDDEKELLKKLENFSRYSRSYREKFENEWEEDERFYYGHHWKFNENKPTKNWCFTTIEGEVPILTDSLPGTDILATDENRDEDAKMLESALHFVYDYEKAMLKQSMAVRNALKTGTGWMYVDYDEDADYGRGMPSIKVIDWKFVYIDPAADDIDEAEYIIIEIPSHLEALRRRFPDKAEKILPIKISEKMPDQKAPDGLDPNRWTPPTRDNGESIRYNDEDMTVLQEYWFKDYSREPIPQEQTIAELQQEMQQLLKADAPEVGKNMDHAAHLQNHSERGFIAQILQIAPEAVTDQDMQIIANTPETLLMLQVFQDHVESHKAMLEINPDGSRPIYENNMRVVMKCGGTILYDEQAEFCTYPLVPVYCYKTSDSVYGIGELKNLIPSQKSYNEMDYAEYKGLRLTSNSGWIKDKNSGVDETTLTNEEGLVVTKNPGTECKRLEPGMVSPQLEQRKANDVMSIERISGVTEVTQGQRPTGVTAAAAITRLQAQAIGRIRLKSRYLELYSMLKLGQLVTERIVKYWNSERKLRIYDSNGRIKRVYFDPMKIKDLEYEIKIAPGSLVGLDKEAIYTVMLQLVQSKMVSPKLFFMSTDLPYKNKILEELEKQDQTNAIIGQLQGQIQSMGSQMQMLMKHNKQLGKQKDGKGQPDTSVPTVEEVPPTQEELATIGAS